MNAYSGESKFHHDNNEFELRQRVRKEDVSVDNLGGFSEMWLLRHPLRRKANLNVDRSENCDTHDIPSVLV